MIGGDYMAKVKHPINHGTANRLKTCRLERGITQEKLAELVGRCEQSIRLYENGRIGVSRKMLNSLAAALSTTVDWLENG